MQREYDDFQNTQHGFCSITEYELIVIIRIRLRTITHKKERRRKRRGRVQVFDGDVRDVQRFEAAKRAAAEAIEEPEPVLSAENKDLLKQEENHFSKIGSDLGYFRAPAIRNDTLVFVSEGSIGFHRERRAGGEDFVQLLVRIGAKVIARWETNRVFSRICGWV